ncbi:MAG: RnfABCDGE type electron transport complex subunit B [Clostridiales bacterium]|nr:RnfABCDGE type electron transport complex subunit B [Clostridiales bacterium]
MNTIAFAVLSVTIIGMVCAVLLSVASKIMAVQMDERAALILQCLPGANCGACGFSGCAGYADALASDSGVKGNLCTPGGVRAAVEIAAILGIASESADKANAVVHCLGSCEVQQKKMDYKGIPSCVAAKELYGGDGSCSFGCMGYGDCQVVCPSGAVCIENGIARINSRLCTGCGLCVKTCPNRLITIEGSGAKVWVLCHNTERGAEVRKKCTAGCIGCGRCVRECQFDAIAVENNLARIDYSKCTGCGSCIEVCVTHCIKPAGSAPESADTPIAS